MYKKRPDPAEATTVAEPNDEQEAEVVVIDIDGETIETGTFIVSALQA